MSSKEIITLGDSRRLEQEFQKNARKREQNRIAQRNYRLNQKKRLRALEIAVNLSSQSARISNLVAPLGSAVDGLASSVHRRSISSISVNSSDESSLAVISNLTSDTLSEAETIPAAPDVSVRHDTADALDIPELAGFLPNKTPLQLAISNKNTSLVQLLLQHGADTSRKDEEGSTMLHLAVESGQQDAVDAILKRGVDPNEPDFSGRPALFKAIRAGNLAVTKLLLDAASDPNHKDMWGNTALHLAVETDSEALSLLLLEYGAHVNP